MATKANKMTKAELAEMAAKAMNLLNDLRCYFGDDFSNRQTNDFHELVCMFPEQIQDDFMNNATLKGRDIS